MEEIKLGTIDDYFAKVGVIAMKLENSVKVGDTIHIKGHTTDINQTVSSMQIEHQVVQEAKKGDSIGIKVNERIRRGDTVYKVLP